MLVGLDKIVQQYVEQIKLSLGEAFHKAILYGSCARNEYSDESDVDIAIFTDTPSSEFYKLVEKISEDTFEFSVKYDVMLSPVFVNEGEYQRMLSVLPYYQSIQKEGIAVG